MLYSEKKENKFQLRVPCSCLVNPGRIYPSYNQKSRFIMGFLQKSTHRFFGRKHELQLNRVISPDLAWKDSLWAGIAGHPASVGEVHWGRISMQICNAVGFPGGTSSKEPVWSLGQEETLEEGMATHASIPAWEIPWTEEPGGPQSTGSQTVRHNWSDLACMHATLSSTSPWKYIINVNVCRLLY